MKTRKDETIITTNKPEEMQGMYLAERLCRGWMEDFVDEDTSEVVSIERKEVILGKGTYLENETISSIMFHIQSGDVAEVTVSNQRREATIMMDGGTRIWSALVEVGKKKVKLLLYANSFDVATAIVKDYVEQNYSGYCKLSQLKEFGDYTVIEESLAKEDADNDTEKKLYKMAMLINDDGHVYSNNFLVFATDVEAASTAINYWISNELNASGHVADFSTTLEQAVIISFTAIIGRDFSEAYIQTAKNEEQ
ncbi:MULTISPECIES: hypothetical protein [unclassified Carboxylicivirga]|uniref:hypothetical protein n=1 Tax=Carboxylicivirga TaxID=1628153 RepID=UPI003D32E4BD